MRSTSITAALPAGSGHGSAGRAPLAASRDSSAMPSRDGRVLSRAPPASTCRLIASAQTVTCRPASAGPSQTCCPPIHKFPDGGTTRSTSTAIQSWLVMVAAVGAASAGRLGAGGRSAGWGGWGWGVLAASWAGMRSSSGEDAGVNRLAGKAMPSDWCGRSVLYSARQASSAACSASMRLERAVDVEQLALQGLVQPLDLAGRGRRVDLGEPVGDAVLPADLVEQDLDRHAGLVEPAGEHLPVVGQHLLRASRRHPSRPRTPGIPVWPSRASPPWPARRTGNGHRYRSRSSPRRRW